MLVDNLTERVHQLEFELTQQIRPNVQNEGYIRELEAQIRQMSEGWQRTERKYESEIDQRDNMIEDLRQKLREKTVIHAERVIQQPVVTTRHTVIEDDNLGNIKLIKQLRQEISTLKDQLTVKNDQLNELRNMKHVERVEYIKEAPKIIRIQDPPLTEIQYKQDPYLIEQNTSLKVEIEKALDQEQKAKLDVRDKLNEIARLRKQVIELNARPPESVFKEKIVTRIQEKPARIGHALGILMDRYDSYQGQKLKHAVFSMLYYHRLFKQYKRLFDQKKEKVLVNQKLEVIDGTFEVWRSLKSSMVDWIFKLFVHSADRAQVRKMYPYFSNSLGILLSFSK